MKTISKYVLFPGIIALMLVLGAVFSLTKTDNVAFGTTNFDNLILSGNIVTGGLKTITATTSTYQFIPTDIGTNESILEVSPFAGALTLSLIGSTTAQTSSFLPNIGDQTEFMIRNATTSAAATITVATTTGDILLKLSSGTTTIPASGVGVVQVFRDSARNLEYVLSVVS